MRFRTNFGAIGCFYVFMAGFYLLMWTNFRHLRTFDLLTLWAWILLAALQMLSRAFVYWDLDASGLKEHRFWRTKLVLWQNVSRVSSPNPRRPSSEFLRIEYRIPASNSKPSRINAGPTTRKEFVAALREFAPQAEFDD
jgi:hypothetical protein